MKPSPALHAVLTRAAEQVARNFGTDYRETYQEGWAWVLGEDPKGEQRIAKLDAWLAEGRHKQAFLAVVEGIGRNGYGKREKAARLGVKPADLDRRKAPRDPDQFDYSEALVDDLLPLAKNPDWVPGDDKPAENSSKLKRTKKAPGEVGNALVMVMDVRRAFKAGHYNSADIAAWLNGSVA